MPQPKIYLAGPEVFLANAVEIGAVKKALCAEYGFEGLFPLDNEKRPPGSPAETARAIYRGNMAMLAAADLTIANLTPYRGPSADAGTVFELGATIGMGKPALGYANDDRPFRARIAAHDHGVRRDASRGVWIDSDGMALEDFGLHDNLMIDCALFEAGFPLVVRHVPAAERYTDLEGFRQCLETARRASAGRAR